MYNQTEGDPSIHYFNIYINFFYLIFGNIGNLLKIAFFLQKPVRSLPCTIYILFSTLSDFIILNNLPLLQLLIHLYPKYHWIQVTVDWSNYRNETILLSYSVSNYDIIMCKVRIYFHMLSTDLSSQMLLFASINRFCSSYRRKKRLNNTHRLVVHFCDYSNVYKLCIISSIITALLSLQHVFNFTILSPSQDCVPQNHVIWAIWISSFHCFLLPILMIIFGILTLKNIRYLSTFGVYFYRLQSRGRHYHQQRKHRFLEICSDCSRHQNSIRYQIERQLTSMIISEIFVTILTLLPYGTYTFYQLLHETEGQTIYYTNRTKWIILFIRATMYFEPSCGFYIYIMTLSTLRKRFLTMIMEKITEIYSCSWNK